MNCCNSDEAAIGRWMVSLPRRKTHVTLELYSWVNIRLFDQHAIVSSSWRVGPRRDLSHKLVHRGDALQAELCHRWMVSLPNNPSTTQGTCHARTMFVGEFPGHVKPRGTLATRKSLHLRRLTAVAVERRSVIVDATSPTRANDHIEVPSFSVSASTSPMVHQEILVRLA
jgi:hypothetical protein